MVSTAASRLYLLSFDLFRSRTISPDCSSEAWAGSGMQMPGSQTSDEFCRIVGLDTCCSPIDRVLPKRFFVLRPQAIYEKICLHGLDPIDDPGLEISLIARDHGWLKHQCHPIQIFLGIRLGHYTNRGQQLLQPGKLAGASV